MFRDARLLLGVIEMCLTVVLVRAILFEFLVSQMCLTVVLMRAILFELLVSEVC